MSRRPTRVEHLRDHTAGNPAEIAAGAPKAAAAQSITSDVEHAELNRMPPITNVPLKRLRLSDLNMRKTNPSEGIRSMAADIALHGLKQNLVVVECAEPDHFEVVAGGRRLLALQHLWDEGTIDGEKMIAVLIEPRSEGRTTSLLENLQRVPPNPADECAAYAAIVDEHKLSADAVAHCATVFGVTRLHVQQRLRLAELADEIFAALREGRITLDAAKAYGTFADHALQRQIFAAEEKRAYGAKHDARNIRDAMGSKTYPAAIAQAVYVGVDAYVAAGGAVEQDLFMGIVQGERLTSPTLLDKLAREKAAEEIEALVKRDGLAGGMLTATFGPYPQAPKSPAGYITKLDHVPAETRPKSIGIYRLVQDGSGLELYGVYEPAGVQRARTETPEERAERLRRSLILSRATQLAALPAIAGTDLERRAAWPDPDDGWLPVMKTSSDEPGVRYIAVYIRVTDEEVAAQEALAEAHLMAEEGLERAQEEAAKAQPVVTVPASDAA